MGDLNPIFGHYAFIYYLLTGQGKFAVQTSPWGGRG
jgi:hypothetical protein